MATKRVRQEAQQRRINLSLMNFFSSFRLELVRFSSRHGAPILLFDNFFEASGDRPLEEQRAALEKLLCRGGFRPEEVFRRICVPRMESEWSHCMIHGGLIEFTSTAQMMRVISECFGQIEDGLGPLGLQLPIVLESADWGLKYDLSPQDGPHTRRFGPYEDE
jgi:hypothetical protein